MNERGSTPAELISSLRLLPHPEGGHFRETYRSAMEVARASDGVIRSASTAIYYLLGAGERSAWHRIKSDEMWHFYDGSPLHIYVLGQADDLTVLKLGNPVIHDGAEFQALVPAGAWFAAECADPQGHSLVGCTVAPGFEFEEFELADKDLLTQTWPQHAQVIERLA